MKIDPDNPVVALCAAGMAVEGDSSAALALFEQAMLGRRDDYDACIAAHFVARHQAIPRLHCERHLAVGEPTSKGVGARRLSNEWCTGQASVLLNGR